MSAQARITAAGISIPPRTGGAVVAALLMIASQAVGAQEGQRSGKEVVDAVCITCHGPGANGAPKIGDREAWAKRAKQGLTGLTENALKGIRQMPAHGGSPGLSDLEIGRAVAYMVNRSGGRWVEPVAGRELLTERSGEQVVKAQCVKCHETGANGAPRIGERSAWIPRLKQGMDYLVRSAIRGHGGMPPRGGQANLTDSEIRNAIAYMFNPAGPASDARGASGGASVAEAAKTGSNRRTVGGMEIYLGIMSAQALLSFPKDSVERSMHGGVPTGADYYHINVSLVDAKTNAPINDAQVEVQVGQPGLTSESKTLEPMAVGAASYGNYLRMKRKAKYEIIVRVRAPGRRPGTEAKFEHTID